MIRSQNLLEQNTGTRGLERTAMTDEMNKACLANAYDESGKCWLEQALVGALYQSHQALECVLNCPSSLLERGEEFSV